MKKSWSRQVPTVLVGLLLVGALFAGPGAYADHEPANKVAASGATTEVLNPNEGRIKVLQERVKVSSSHDLILSLTSECSILTALRTGDNAGPGDADDATDMARAFGQLQFYIEIDGKRVPVTSTETSPSGPGTATDTDPGQNHGADQVGKVVFCNREYQRTITDSEDNGQTPDGTDTEEDFIRTRTANGFNWLALDVGFNYDDKCVSGGTGCAGPTPANGNNVVDVIVYADFLRQPEQCPANAVPSEAFDACAQAIVGRRTLIVEPTNASNHEWVSETDTGGN